MSMVQRLIKQLESRGLKVVWKGGDVLALTGDTAGVDETVMKAVKAFKADLLAVYRPAVQQAAEQANDPANVVKLTKPEPSGEWCKQCGTEVFMPADVAAFCAHRRPLAGPCPYRGRAHE